MTKNRKKRISLKDAQYFLKALKGWSELPTSYFFTEFINLFNMTTPQFYTRIKKCEELLDEFDYEEICKSLRRNRYIKNVVKARKKRKRVPQRASFGRLHQFD